MSLTRGAARVASIKSSLVWENIWRSYSSLLVGPCFKPMAILSLHPRETACLHKQSENIIILRFSDSWLQKIDETGEQITNLQKFVALSSLVERLK